MRAKKIPIKLLLEALEDMSLHYLSVDIEVRDGNVHIYPAEEVGEEEIIKLKDLDIRDLL